MSRTSNKSRPGLPFLLLAFPLAGVRADASIESIFEPLEWRLALIFSACSASLFSVLAALLWRAHRRQVAELQGRVKNLESEAAESRERLQTYLAGVAHDLSQPLTTLHGTLELALLSRTIPASAHAALEEALQHTQTAAALIRLLRELADAESSGTAARATSVKKLLEEMREDIETLAGLRGVRVDLKVDNSCFVLANPPDLRRSILYLVEHALDRSPAGGWVGISVAVESSAASIVIDDQGPAIPAEDLPHWFEPFPANHSSTAGKRDALRLAIVERSTASCWGSVSVMNTPGGGARFVLRLPLA
jgi:signal transduction histidine kinase